MSQLKRKLFVAALSIMTFGICQQGAQAQSFLKAQGKEIVDESGTSIILRGMGLGGWMLQEGYMLQTAGFANAQYKIKASIEDLIGAESTDEFYAAWLEHHVTREDIDSLRSWGFNSVRLPMHYNLYTLPIEDEPVQGQHTWLDQGFVMTDSLISWCRANDMYVILDLHAAPGGQGKDEGISDYDTSKPSLWESEANRAKTVALWRRLAERYADEPIIAGYDLINETNWPLENNEPLKQIYLDITQAIRQVDKRHIIFIEGNWFANDFTNLTPPWDDNLVYSPHKYWSINDQASIQWVIDIRNRYDVPIYFGESGENSNVWFSDAIRLLEDHNMGWAWWPMKKVESIAGPLSVIKTDGYQQLLNYWNNGGDKPEPEVAKSILMQLTEFLKIENCIYQKDVIDAMFRQVHSTKAVPFQMQQIPGVVYPSDFDMGHQGVAYFDTEVANYQVSTGNYTSWNNGWVYRNDGVDLEKSTDNVNSNGYNVGWLSTGEWMQYDVEITENGVYDINVRVASNSEGGRFHFQSGSADISRSVSVPNTQGWQTWQTVTVSDVILNGGDTKLQFHVDRQEFNLGSFEFVKTAESNLVPAQFLSAFTIDDQAIQVNLNKPMLESITATPSTFKVFINDQEVAISSIDYDEGTTRSFVIFIGHAIRSQDDVRVSYDGADLQGEDGTSLQSFSKEVVQNRVAVVHLLPGIVQAEDYFNQSGIQLENTTDIGGGQNIGFLDNGDYLDYYIEVAEAATFSVDYRTASLSEEGAVALELIDEDGQVSLLHEVSFPATGDWQTWAITSKEASIPAGRHHLRIVIKQPLFNMNWIEFSKTTSVTELKLESEVRLYPNPTSSILYVDAVLSDRQDIKLNITDAFGKVIWIREKKNARIIHELIDLLVWPSGTYFLTIEDKKGRVSRSQIIKIE